MIISDKYFWCFLYNRFANIVFYCLGVNTQPQCQAHLPCKLQILLSHYKCRWRTLCCLQLISNDFSWRPFPKQTKHLAQSDCELCFFLLIPLILVSGCQQDSPRNPHTRDCCPKLGGFCLYHQVVGYQLHSTDQYSVPHDRQRSWDGMCVTWRPFSLAHHLHPCPQIWACLQGCMPWSDSCRCTGYHNCPNVTRNCPRVETVF